MAAPFEGYLSILSVGGTSTAYNALACSLVAGGSAGIGPYQINTSADRVLDPTVARVWWANGSPVSAANIASENLMDGTVTFATSQTAPITAHSGNYIPLVAVARVQKANVDIMCESDDVTSINTAGYRMRQITLEDWSGKLTLFDDMAAGSALAFAGTNLVGRVPLLLQVDFEGAGAEVFRGWCCNSDDTLNFDPAKVISTEMSVVGTDYGILGTAIGTPLLSSAAFYFGPP
jgi:hypothetical protein